MKGILKRPASAMASSGSEAAAAPVPNTAAERAIVAAASGERSQKNAQGIMNHLNMLAKKGRPEVLAEYKSKKTAADKQDFVRHLALDFEASFVEATEERSASKEVVGTDIDGWLYAWEIAAQEGIPYTKDNMELIMALCESFPDAESDKPALKDAGHKLYHYEKQKAKVVTNTGKREIKLTKKAEVDDLQSCKDIENAMGKAVGDKDFAGWTSSKNSGGHKKVGGGGGGGGKAGSSTDPPEDADKKEWLKAAGQAKNAVAKAIEGGKSYLVKIERDDSGVLSQAFTKGLAKIIGKMQVQYEGLIKKISVAEGANPKSFGKGKGKVYDDPWKGVGGLLDSYQSDFKLVASRHYK